MSMNNYITLDGLKYMAPHGDFGQMRGKPSTERVTLSGRTDVTYGPATLVEWSGSLIAPVTPPDTGWGDVDDLRYTLGKRQSLAFTNHYGVAGVVYAVGPHGEISFAPVWDAASNEFYITVKLLMDIGGGAIVPLDALYGGLSPETISTVGGEVTVELSTLDIAASLMHMFPSIPVDMQEIYLASSAVDISIPQLIAMDTLTLAGSIPAMTVT